MLTIDGQFPGTSELQAILDNFETRDDVWSRDFIGSIIVQTTEMIANSPETKKKFFVALGLATYVYSTMARRKPSFPRVLIFCITASFTKPISCT